MNQLLVRKLGDHVKRRLRERAKRHGISMEEEARVILSTAVLKNEDDEYGMGTKIANLFRDIPDNDEPFERPLRGSVRRIEFDK